MDYYDEKGRKLNAAEVTSPVRGLVVRAVRTEVQESAVVNGETVVRAKTVTQYRAVYDKDGNVATLPPGRLVLPLPAR
jgi:hypothetical protein